MKWMIIEHCPACNRSHPISVETQATQKTEEQERLHSLNPLGVLVLGVVAVAAGIYGGIFGGKSRTKGREEDSPWVDATFYCEEAGRKVRAPDLSGNQRDTFWPAFR
jgi:hypothetical protein